ncbi:MAG: DUF1043 family protein [Deltaproteobacteria bacterium]|nr:DUF1043 family protein [Deltaproteobacteria bacterium]MBW2414252.1 DUF1043 family protein [Deltaproteobacteria bacterium]
MGGEWAPIAAAVVMFLAGMCAGAWLRRPDRGARARVVELERDLEQLASRLHSERESVTKHFDRTSDLFRDLTREYTTLYAHLAEGARELCPQRTPEIGRGLGGDLAALTAGGAGGTGGPEIASADEASNDEEAPDPSAREADPEPAQAASAGGI